MVREGLRINRWRMGEWRMGTLWRRTMRGSASPTTRPAGPSRPSPPGGRCWTPPANCSSSMGMRSRRSRTSPAAPGSPWTRSTRPSAANPLCCAKSWRPRSPEAIRPCPPSSATTWRVSGPRRAPGRRSRRTSRPWSKSSPASPRSTWPCATPPPPTPTPRQRGARSASDVPATCAHLPPTSAPPVSCAQTCPMTPSQNIVWSMNGPEYWTLLVSDRGWSAEQFGNHLTDAWQRMFLARAPQSRQ